MTQEPTVVPAARRLRRLRWMMTVAFTLANLAGLVALALVALKVDASSHRRAEVNDVRHRARTAAELSFTDEGELYTEWLAADEVADGHPEVYVLVRRDGQLTVGFTGRNRTHDIPLRWLRLAAGQAMSPPHRVTVKARDAHDRPVFLVAAPIFDDGGGDEPSGAAIAVGDPDAGAAEHLRLAWALIAGTAVLSLVSAALGHTLSGRSVRPAIASLTEHERLLADAAHELRTPVAALRAAAETAIAESQASGPQPAIDASAYRAHLDSVLRHTQRLGSVLDALLTRARLAAGSQAIGREPLRLDLLAEDTLADVCGDLGIPLEHTVIDAEPSVVEADPALLRLALRNLLENAIRHGRPPDEPTRLRVEVSARSIAVSDNGPGVPPELLTAPIARYSSRTGNGIGLSIAADVAAAHGGRLEVRNAPDGGAVFTLTLS